MNNMNDDAWTEYEEMKARHKGNGWDHGNEPRFLLRPFADIRLGSDPKYVVKGLIPRPGLTVVWGPPKCGKSFFVADMAIHVAIGWEYRGHRVQQGPVVYLALEGSAGFVARLEAFRIRFVGMIDPSAVVPFHLIANRLDLVQDHVQLIRDIEAQIGSKMPVMIVIDTLNRSLTGSESSDQDMGAYIKAADALKDAFGAAVVIVHHCGVDGTRPRGHTSLGGAVDAQIAVKRDTTGIITSKVEWMKDGPEGDEIYSRLEPIEVGIDRDGDPIISCVIVPTDSQPTNDQRLSGNARLAWDCLSDLLADSDTRHPGGPHVPANVITVTQDAWRKLFYARNVADSSDPVKVQNAKQKAFKRASAALHERGFIGLFEGIVWSARKNAP